MSRMARFVITDVPYHITQRGNFKQDVFYEEDDRRFYLDRLSQFSQKWKLDILAYCLMKNHVHLIVIPRERDSLARCLGTLHMCHAQYINKKHDIVGHLWQARFYSSLMDEQHLYAAVRYVECNPVRAGLVQHPWEWPWSSAPSHLGMSHSQVKLFDLRNIMRVKNWLHYLTQESDKKIIERIKKCTLTGKILGSKEFIQKLEQMTGHSLRSRYI